MWSSIQRQGQEGHCIACMCAHEGVSTLVFYVYKREIDCELMWRAEKSTKLDKMQLHQNKNCFVFFSYAKHE